MNQLDPFHWARTPWQGGDRVPDVARHQSMLALTDLSPSLTVQKQPTLAGIVVRKPDGSRGQPNHVQVTPAGGLEGDRWALGKRKLSDQVAMMNLSVAHRIANGQSVVFSGDNLFADLDLSLANLPPKRRLTIGEVIFEVSEEVHTPCHLFKARFGDAAFRRAAQVERLRGVYLTVLSAGVLHVGDEIVVLGDGD